MLLAEEACGGGALGFVVTSLYLLLLIASRASTTEDMSSVLFSLWPGINDSHAKISPSFWLFDDEEKRWLIITHPSDSLAVEGLTKEANSGKINEKQVLGSDLIVKGANEERSNRSQESTKILNSNTASTVLHELVHADLSYVLPLVGSKKESCTLVVKFKMLWVQQPTFQDGIFSCMTYSDTFITI